MIKKTTHFLSFVASIAIAAAMVFTISPAVFAHAELESAIPAPNATVTESPKQLMLKFSEQIQLGSSVTLLDAKGTKVELTDAKVDPADTAGKTFIATVPTELGVGKYSVQWKSFSVDGHTETGKYSFKVDLPNVTGDVTLKFALRAGKEAVTCGKDVTTMGLRQAKKIVKTQIVDARMYLSNIRLISTEGKEVALQLKADGKWQSKDIALLDFEDGTGLCKDSGTPDTRFIIEGNVSAGKYTGIAFQLGVPFELNHADVATSKTPLNVQALWWNWQSGYKFARIDLRTDAAAPNNDFLIHLGSTGCGDTAMDHSAPSNAKPATAAGKTVTGTMAMSSTVAMTGTTTEAPKMDMSVMNKPPAMPCKNPNTMQVKLIGFDPSKDVIVADLAGLTGNVDITHPKPQPAGCMSGTDDPDCKRLFPNFGLILASGACANNCRNQKFFRVDVAAKP